MAEELLDSYYSAEHTVAEYVTALETNLDANEQLKNKYTVADSIVGGLASLSSPAVIFATAPIAAPIAGAIWIAIGLSIQQFNIAPQIKEGRK